MQQWRQTQTAWCMFLIERGLELMFFRAEQLQVSAAKFQYRLTIFPVNPECCTIRFLTDVVPRTEMYEGSATLIVRSQTTDRVPVSFPCPHPRYHTTSSSYSQRCAGRRCQSIVSRLSQWRWAWYQSSLNKNEPGAINNKAKCLQGLTQNEVGVEDQQPDKLVFQKLGSARLRGKTVSWQLIDYIARAVHLLLIDDINK